MSQNKHKKLPSWLIDRLPELERAESVEYIPQRFADSTHDLWRLKLIHGNYVLKVCSNTDSPFWQIMQQLFGFHLKRDIQYFDALYQHIATLTSLSVPDLIKAESIETGAFILSTELQGSVPDHSAIHPDMVTQLALHLAELHQDQRSHWGLMHQPLFDSKDWQQQLSNTLAKSASKWGGDHNKHSSYLNCALEACKHIESHAFVPVMPDLRWDQFFKTDNMLTALLDLDAFVIAPCELDFVLLEYILSPEHIKLFINTYSQHHPIPDIGGVRPAYRLLMYYMEVLGEQNIDKWMNVPHRF